MSWLRLLVRFVLGVVRRAVFACVVLIAWQIVPLPAREFAEHRVLRPAARWVCTTVDALRARLGHDDPRGRRR